MDNPLGLIDHRNDLGRRIDRDELRMLLEQSVIALGRQAAESALFPVGGPTGPETVGPTGRAGYPTDGTAECAGDRQTNPFDAAPSRRLVLVSAEMSDCLKRLI